MPVLTRWLVPAQFKENRRLPRATSFHLHELVGLKLVAHREVRPLWRSLHTGKTQLCGGPYDKHDLPREYGQGHLTWITPWFALVDAPEYVRAASECREQKHHPVKVAFAKRAVSLWNDVHVEGTRVMYCSDPCNDPPFATVTTSDAYERAGIPLIFMEGIDGPVPLQHVLVVAK